MTALSKDVVLQALNGVNVPGTGGTLVSEGMISAVRVEKRDGAEHVHFVVEIDPSRVADMESVRLSAVQAVQAIGGVGEVTAVLAAHRPSSTTAGKGGGKTLPKGVRRIVAVASGKGGVGKSTVAANLALALAQQGIRVGLLDIDVYGPSVPRLMGIKNVGVEQGPDGSLMPIMAHGIAVMSIGLLVDEQTPMIWRGPMVHGAIRQMLFDVAWEGLDMLILDMPPGTGDAALSVAQSVPLAGAVIVSTPQDLALLDVRKSIAMFRKIGVPLLGLVENMARFECPHCGKATDIFGCGGAQKDAERLGLPFLGRLPLTMDLRLSADAGEPLVVRAKESALAVTLAGIAARVIRETHCCPAIKRTDSIGQESHCQNFVEPYH